jgi:hypothetical protein
LLLYSSHLPLGVPNGLVINHASRVQLKNANVGLMGMATSFLPAQVGYGEEEERGRRLGFHLAALGSSVGGLLKLFFSIPLFSSKWRLRPLASTSK